MVFNGNQFAERKLNTLLRLDSDHRKKSIVVLLDPDNLQGRVYVNAKRKVAELLGVNFNVYSIPDIEAWNSDESIDGIMIQLPYKGSRELIEQISPKKDVDGLREDSPYLMGVTRGVMAVLNEALKGKNGNLLNWVVLGSSGVVGTNVMEQLHKMELTNLVGMDATTMDLDKLKQADVVISATGVQGMFDEEMVRDGVIIIDIGFPKGDFSSNVAKKASFFTPVPGGVGPVTVVSLFENLLGV